MPRIFFAGKIAQPFYGFTEDFAEAFDCGEAPGRVVIDVSRAYIWDISSLPALDTVILKFRREGVEVDVLGMNRAADTLADKLAIQTKPGALAG